MGPRHVVAVVVGFVVAVVVVVRPGVSEVNFSGSAS